MCFHPLIVIFAGEGSIETAGLDPILFAFIVLASRLSGSVQPIEGTSDRFAQPTDTWIQKTTQIISEINGSPSLFCRTMSARAMVFYGEID